MDDKLSEKLMEGGMEGAEVTIMAARGEDIGDSRLKAGMALIRAALQIRRETGIDNRFNIQKQLQIMNTFFQSPEEKLEYMKTTNPSYATPIEPLLLSRPKDKKK